MTPPWVRHTFKAVLLSRLQSLPELQGDKKGDNKNHSYEKQNTTEQPTVLRFQNVYQVYVFPLSIFRFYRIKIFVCN